ncbi:MAG: cellulase family glycosylhydrolase [Planctomycetota bacterium]
MKLQYLNEGIPIDIVENFYQAWRDNFITEADIEFIHSLGFNSVRLPLHYELFLTENQKAFRNLVITNPNAFHDAYKDQLQNWYDQGELFTDSQVEGFQIIDRLVHWCEERGMYVILDMHAAPGAQGSGLDITDGFFANNLWQFSVFQDVLDELWGSISNRYRSEPRIALYELINEPNNVPGGGQAIQALTQRLISTIRQNDDTHMICVHGNAFGNFYDFLEPFNFSPNWSLVYSAHRYQINLEDDFGNPGHPNQINRMVDMTNFRDTHRVPIYVGETGENSNEWMMQNIANIESAGIGWAHWTYKRHDVFENPALMRIGGNYPTDGFSVNGTVLNSIQFQNCIPNQNTINAVTSTLPAAGESTCNGTGVTPPLGTTIWFECNTGNYISSEGGFGPMQCNLADIELLGLFTVVDAGNGKVALLGSNGRYVSSENGEAEITCNRSEIGWWERFDWVDFSNGSFGLRGNNGRYISSENGGPMTCIRETAGAWEQFDVGRQGDTNCDGIVNLLDIAPFVNYLSNGTYSAKVDFNQDGRLNLLDVSLFVAVLSGS